MNELLKKHHKGCMVANSHVRDPDNYECYCDLVEEGRQAVNKGSIKKCQDCDAGLEVVFNYPGGGSHYWILWCRDCKIQQLRPQPEKGREETFPMTEEGKEMPDTTYIFGESSETAWLSDARPTKKEAFTAATDLIKDWCWEVWDGGDGVKADLVTPELVLKAATDMVLTTIIESDPGADPDLLEALADGVKSWREDNAEELEQTEAGDAPELKKLELKDEIDRLSLEAARMATQLENLKTRFGEVEKEEAEVPDHSSSVGVECVPVYGAGFPPPEKREKTKRTERKQQRKN